MTDLPEFNQDQPNDKISQNLTSQLPITMQYLQSPPGGTVLPPPNNQLAKPMPQFQTTYLKMMETSPLNWGNGEFNYPGMVRIGTPPDGSCFFHAIASAYFLPYRRGSIDGVPMDRYAFIRDLRYDLAIKLDEKVDPQNSNSPIHYDLLSRGNLREFAGDIQQYTLESMKRELNSDRSVDNVYNEFISNILEKDIYLLDITTQDIYVTGDDFDILYKGRSSIVTLAIPGHYELVGLQTSTGIKSLFDADHPFIQSIKSRLREKIKRGFEQ